VTHDDRDKPLSGAWWRFPKWLWRYVMSVFRVQGMVKRRADSSMSFAVFHPFLNLTEELAKSFSPQEVSLSASSFVENNRVSTELRQRGPSSAKSPPTCPRCRLYNYAIFNACSLFHSRRNGSSGQPTASSTNAEDIRGVRASQHPRLPHHHR